MVYEFTRYAGGGVRAKMPYRRNGSEESHEGERDTKHHKQDAKSHRRSLGVVILWSLPLRITLRSDVATVQNVLAPFVKLDDNASRGKHNGEENR
jgi:hypothetical protein